MKFCNIFIPLAIVLIALFACACSPQQKKTLRVGTDAENPPFTYLEGNEFKGIDIEICKRIADKLKMELQITRYRFDDLFSALALNKIDVAASAITITSKRKQTMDFTIPYFETDLAVVTKTNSPIKVEMIEDLGKYIVGCQSQTTSHQYLTENLMEKDLLPKEKLKLYPTVIETLGELLNNKIDLMVFDEWVAKDFSRQQDIKIIYIIPTHEQYGLAMQTGKEINAKINKALIELEESGELECIIKEYME